MKMTNRHNEVWYLVDGEHVCPPAGTEWKLPLEGAVTNEEEEVRSKCYIS